MAMKKAAPKKAAPKAEGSDRGAKAKANEAEKKSQMKNRREMNTDLKRPGSFGENLMSPRVYNSFAGDMGNSRTNSRVSAVANRAKAAKEAAVKAKETAMKAKTARKAKQKER
jgi:hypothetical protein